jgi:hypothetical protein
VRGEDVERVVTGRIKIADHVSRKHRPEPKAPPTRKAAKR